MASPRRRVHAVFMRSVLPNRSAIPVACSLIKLVLKIGLILNWYRKGARNFALRTME